MANLRLKREGAIGTVQMTSGVTTLNTSSPALVPFSPIGYRYLVLKIGRLRSTDTLAANVRLHGVILEYTSNA